MCCENKGANVCGLYCLSKVIFVCFSIFSYFTLRTFTADHTRSNLSCIRLFNSASPSDFDFFSFFLNNLFNSFLQPMIKRKIIMRKIV